MAAMLRGSIHRRLGDGGEDGNSSSGYAATRRCLCYTIIIRACFGLICGVNIVEKAAFKEFLLAVAPEHQALEEH